MATYEQSLLIGGQWMPADGDKTYECVNPFTGETATRAAAASVGDVARAVSAAQDAFGAWAALPPSKRRQHMLAAADAIEARLPELSEAMTSEMGGPAAVGLYNVNSLAERFRFAAGAAFDGLTGEVIPSENPGAHDDGHSQAPWRRREHGTLERSSAAGGQLSAGRARPWKRRRHQGVGTDAPHAWAGGGMPCGSRLAGRGGESHHQRARERAPGRRGLDRPQTRASHPFYRLHADRSHHRRTGRQTPEARDPRAGRQGAVHCLGGCGP